MQGSREALPPTPWITCRRPNPLAYLRVFCFPYAGGTATVYRNWADKLTPAVEVVPVETPGRGPRFKEEPLTDLRRMARELVSALDPYFEMPFAFFGYSMGGHIGFELARELRRQGKPLPAHMIVAAALPPTGPAPEPNLHGLSDEELKEELRKYEGTPESVLQNETMMDTLLPTIRADFALSENYVFEPEETFDFPISVLGGTEDHAVPRQHLEDWRQQTKGAFSLRMLEGGHFFIHTAERDLLRILSAELHEIAKKVARSERYNV